MTEQMTAPHKIALALQGGGSHGAFTWGVLDRLLEEPNLTIGSVTGASAGAMNAVVLAHGLLDGGHEGARRALREFWESVGRVPGLASFFGPLQSGAPGQWHLDNSPIYILFDFISRVWSPYELNPLNLHPLRDIVTGLVDFDALRRSTAPRVTVCATNVRTGRRRVFGNAELTADAVLASACLPYLFPATEIDGEPYWDGGYTGNPAIAPLLRGDSEVSDLIIVAINPLVRDETPKTARDIINRVTEISFNSTFLLELAAIAFVGKLCADHGIQDKRARQMFFHGIGAEAELSAMGASSKLNNHPAFLSHLFGIGREAAGEWLAANRAAIGRRSTIDLTQLLPSDMLG